MQTQLLAMQTLFILVVTWLVLRQHLAVISPTAMTPPLTTIQFPQHPAGITRPMKIHSNRIIVHCISITILQVEIVEMELQLSVAMDIFAVCRVMAMLVIIYL